MISVLLLRVFSGVKHLLLPSLNAHFSPFTFVSFALKIVRNSTAKHERIYLKKKTKKKNREHFSSRNKGREQSGLVLLVLVLVLVLVARKTRNDGVFIECNSGEES